jgi:protein-S-isoprenylcysteine O-methyltransferase Ste14
MERTLFRFAGAAIIAALALAATWKGDGTRLAIGLIVGLPAFVLMVVSRRQLGGSFSVMPEARGLVTSGLYSRIMHPMYFFLDLFLIGLVVIIGWPVLVGAWALLVIVQSLQARREERVLSEAFGTQYDAYANRTWF